MYRNLERLERLGVVRHVHLGHGPGLYALAAAATASTWSASAAAGSRRSTPRRSTGAREDPRRSFGYEVRFRHFPIHGFCDTCAQAARDDDR